MEDALGMYVVPLAMYGYMVGLSWTALLDALDIKLSNPATLSVTTGPGALGSHCPE